MPSRQGRARATGHRPGATGTAGMQCLPSVTGPPTAGQVTNGRGPRPTRRGLQSGRRPRRPRDAQRHAVRRHAGTRTRPRRRGPAAFGLVSLALLLALYGAACAWLYTSQRSLLYYPVRAASLAHAQTLPGRDANVLYSGREVPGPDALVYFGGNAEDVSRTLPDLAQAFPGHALYLLHYRGYGGSAASRRKSHCAAMRSRFTTSHARAMGRSSSSAAAWAPAWPRRSRPCARQADSCW